LVPVFFGISNLDYIAASFILERFVALIGILLLTPIFLPEQNKDIAELVESKYTSQEVIYIMRLAFAVLSLFVLISAFVTIMLLLSCEFGAVRFVIGTFSTAFFLGALGFAAYAISDNIVAGYLCPIGYYVLNFFLGGDIGRNIYLFSLADNSLVEKYLLLIVGTLLTATGIVARWIKKRLR